MKPFELRPELANQILHAMEDQNADYVLNTTDQTLRDIAKVANPDDPHLIPIPDWEPSDGYALMESFVLGLNNPEWRERLREALSSGRGAFKRFKATAKQNRHIIAAWRRHKQTRMLARVYDWYNDLRESWGLNPLEPEETSEDRQALLLEDFSLERRNLAPFGKAIQTLLEAAHRELYRTLPEELVGALYEEPQWLSGGHAGSVGAPEGIVALDPEEGLAGVIWESRRGPLIELQELLVLPAYRGIGLGGLLFDRWFEDALAGDAAFILVRRGLSHPAIRALAEGRGFDSSEIGYLYPRQEWTRRRLTHGPPGS